MKTIATFSMCLNEIHFIELYLRSNLRYAEQVILIDGGSSDGTLDILYDYSKRYPGRVIYEVMPQTCKPYAREWNTGTRRQRCLDLAKTGWVFALDVDELVSDKLLVELPGLINDDSINFTRGRVVATNFVVFWKDFNTVRVNHPQDARWSVMRDQLWTHNGKVSYRDENPHSVASGFSSLERLVRPDLEILHLHYAGKRFLKAYDNRRGDLNCGLDRENVDWEGKHLTEYAIVTKPFTGEYPAILKEMGYL